MQDEWKIRKGNISEEKMKSKLQGLPQIFSEFYYSMTNKSYLTCENYISHVEDFMNFSTHGERNEEFYKTITPLDINKYMSSIKTYRSNEGIKKMSDSALAARWSSLNAFFKFLYLNGYVPENVVEKTERPKIKDEKKKEPLDKKEIKKIATNIDNNKYHKNINRDKLIFALGITTGLRVSAISQLNVEDVDLEHNRLQVVEKGNKYRVVEFGEHLHYLFVAYLQDREEYYSDVDTDALFISQKKQRITNRSIRNLLEKYAKTATDKHVSAHTLRRTSATQLYNKTGDIYLVGNHLGHADISTTKRYISIDEEKQKSKIEFMDNIIG